MISQTSFENSSSWHINNPRMGAISLKFRKQDDGSFEARLLQYLSATDRDYIKKDATFQPVDAYSRLVAAIGRYLETHKDQLLAEKSEAYAAYRVGTLSREFNPFHLNNGKGKSGNGYLFVSREYPDVMLFASTPETSGDESKKAVFLQLEKRDGLWADVEITPDLIDSVKNSHVVWPRKAAERLVFAAPGLKMSA